MTRAVLPLPRVAVIKERLFHGGERYIRAEIFERRRQGVIHRYLRYYWGAELYSFYLGSVTIKK